ncbi:MAG: MOSC domain-containing protein [Actinomycetota bacterium]|nr:MOSC domain-containing protein [Actinomycetota bacterium]
MEVKALWRYPVKSLLGERLSSVDVTKLGFEGDRVFALRAGDAVLSAKRTSSLFGASARWVDGDVEIVWADRSMSRRDDPGLDRKLSELAGREVVLSRRGDTVEIISGQDATTTDGPDGRFTGPAGTFFDAAPLHILTTSTLQLLRSLHPKGHIDERRFRPNVLIDTGDEAAELEQGWIGTELSLGTSMVRIARQCNRCVMTTHAQADLPQDKDVLRVVARSTANVVGVLAEVVTPGTIALGDPVAPAKLPG